MESIRKIIIAAAALFAVQNAAAVGHFLEIQIEGSNRYFYVVAEYPNAGLALSAAIELCGASTDHTAAACTTTDNTANQFVLTSESFENTEVHFNDVPNTSDFGIGVDAAAVSAFRIQRCMDLNLPLCDAFANTIPIPLICRDGRERTGADDCHSVFVEPNCNLANTEYNMATGECDCLAATPERVDELSCRAATPTSAADCPGEFFNNAVSPARCDQFITTCTDSTVELDMTTNQCRCVTAGDDFVSGSNMQMCETPPPAALVCGENAKEENSVCVCENSDTHREVENSDPFMCELIPQSPETNTGETAPANDSDSKPKEFAYIGAGVFVVGAAAVFLSGGGLPIFTYSPDFGYRITESGYSANAGGRADFRKDDWHFYYSADSDFHRNGSLEFRYKSGGKYTADIWAATFSESVQGETADYDFSLSANLTGGIWNISPVYRMHSEYEKGETETQNTLNLEGILRYNGWQIRPSAGFRWENADGFAENARFRINAVHRF